ncbi:MAG: phosphodiesterase YaeI [Verrucomicrobiota bacterium]
MSLSRRNFWLSLLGTLAAPVGIYGYMRREASDFEVTHTDISLSGIEKTISILHLSDIHSSEDVPFDLLKRAVNLAVSSCDPDFVCLTGDYKTTDFPDQAEFIETLSPISEIAPAFAIIGNHDFSPRPDGMVTFKPMLDLLRACRFDPLFNEKRIVACGDQTLELYGLGDIWSGTCRPQNCLNRLDETEGPRPPRLVLSHNPDSKTVLQPYDWDLMLCGHTHGGQIKIPFTDIRPILPISDKAFSAGLYDWDQRKVFITRGVGNQHGLRFNCRPEISVIHLQPSNT